MRSTADGVFSRGGGLWGEGKCVSRKMNGVGGESGLRTDPQRKEQSGRLWGAAKTVRRKMNSLGGKRTADGSAEKRAKMGGHWAQRGWKEVDGWRQGGERTADGSAEKGAKMRGVATQLAPESNEWRIQTHQAYGASRADTGRPDPDAIRRTHIFFLLMFQGPLPQP